MTSADTARRGPLFSAGFGMAVFGALMALGAPGYGLWLLPWVALIAPLCWIDRQSGKPEVFWAGFGFGFAYFGLFCLWFFSIHPLMWFGFSPIGSLLVALAGWLLIALEGAFLFGVLFLLYQTLKSSGWGRVFLFPLLWVLGFSVLNLTPLALPWALVEYTQANVVPLRWLAGWISGSGIAYLLILHNTLGAVGVKIALKGREGIHGWRRGLVYAALPSCLVPILLWGTNNIQFQPAVPAQLPSPVVVIQANLPIDVIRSGHLSAEALEPAYLNPLRRALIPRGTLVAYPEEGVVPGWVSMQRPAENPFLWELQQISQAKGCYITVGASVWDENNGKHYNALVLISPGNRPVQFYAKRRLVPFGEYTPYGWGEGLSRMLGAFNIAYMDAFESGRSAAFLNAGAMRIGGLVCFELIDSNPFGLGYAMAYKRIGTNLLVNASNLGWFHQNPWLDAQFLAIGQMRSAETGLPLVIASNTGISAILAPGGRILRMTDSRVLSQHKTQVLFYNGKESVAPMDGGR